MTLPEGPFGEFTGYYAADARPCPVMQVEAIHHRDDPILLGSPPMKPPRFHFGLPFRAAAIWSNLEMAGVTDVVGVWQHVAQLMTVVALKQRYAGHAKRAGADRRRQQLHGPAGRGGGRRRRSLRPRRRDVGGHHALRAGRADRHRAQRLVARRSIRASRRRTSAAGITSHSKAIIEAVRPFGWKDKYPPTSALTQDEAREIEDKWGAVLKGDR